MAISALVVALMAGADEFEQRTRFLSQQVGTGSITAKLVVDQPYAQDQHETLEYEHSTGQAKYLETPLFSKSAVYMEHIGDRVITEAGSDIADAMIDIAEDLSDEVEIFAPIDTGELHQSGNPQVIDKGVELYNRPPRVPRIRE